MTGESLTRLTDRIADWREAEQYLTTHYEYGAAELLRTQVALMDMQREHMLNGLGEDDE